MRVRVAGCRMIGSGLGRVLGDPSPAWEAPAWLPSRARTRGEGGEEDVLTCEP